MKKASIYIIFVIFLLVSTFIVSSQMLPTQKVHKDKNAIISSKSPTTPGNSLPLCDRFDYIFSQAGDQFHPDIEGRYIAWEDYSTGSLSQGSIGIYDLGLNKRFDNGLDDRGPFFISQNALQKNPHIERTTLMWTSYGFGSGTSFESCDLAIPYGVPNSCYSPGSQQTIFTVNNEVLEFDFEDFYVAWIEKVPRTTNTELYFCDLRISGNQNGSCRNNPIRIPTNTLSVKRLLSVSEDQLHWIEGNSIMEYTLQYGIRSFDQQYSLRSNHFDKKKFFPGVDLLVSTYNNFQTTGTSQLSVGSIASNAYVTSRSFSLGSCIQEISLNENSRGYFESYVGLIGVDCMGDIRDLRVMDLSTGVNETVYQTTFGEGMKNLMMNERNLVAELETRNSRGRVSNIAISHCR